MYRELALEGETADLYSNFHRKPVLHDYVCISSIFNIHLLILLVSNNGVEWKGISQEPDMLTKIE